MAAGRRLTLCALLFMATASPGCYADDRAESATKDIDAKLAAIRSDLAAQTISRAEFESRLKALGDRVTDMESAYKKQIELLKDNLATTNARVPTLPAELTLVVPAMISILVAFVTIYFSMSSAARISRANRANLKEDLAQSLARQLVSEWDANFVLIGKALHTLRNDPQGLSDAYRYTEVRRAGNLYERIAQAWKDGDGDRRVFEKSDIKVAAGTFWEYLTSASERLAQHPINGVALDQDMQGWPHLRWLAA